MNSNRQLYDRNFVLAMVCQTSFVIANTLMAHYARWIEFLGGNVRQVGWIMGAGAVLGVVVRPWMGLWINRLGARVMWLLGFAVFTVGAWGNLLLDDLHPVIYLLRSAVILGAAIVFASSLTYVSQIAPVQRRTEAIGILGIGGFLGMLVGPAWGDLLLPYERSRENFVVLFLAAGLACGVAAVLVRTLSVPRGQGAGSAVRLVDFIRSVRTHWPGMVLAVDLVFGVCMTVPFVFLASFVDAHTLHIPGVSVIGLFFWCYAGLGVCLRLVLRRLPELIGARKVLVAGMLSMSAGMFCFVLVDTTRPGWIVLPALLAGAGHSLMFHTMTSLTIERFPHHVHGTGAALALMMLDLGTIAGAPMLGHIAETHGFHAMFATIGMLTLCVAAAFSLSRWKTARAESSAKVAEHV